MAAAAVQECASKPATKVSLSPSLTGRLAGTRRRGQAVLPLPHSVPVPVTVTECHCHWQCSRDESETMAVLAQVLFCQWPGWLGDLGHDYVTVTVTTPVSHDQATRYPGTRVPG
eukprot:1580694-Rhodomonas_salina.3